MTSFFLKRKKKKEIKFSYKSNIWKFSLFKIVGSFELTISIFVLFMLENGLTMTQVMSLEALFIILTLILNMPAGVFADIHGRKLSLFMSAIFATLSFITFWLGSTYFVFMLANILLAFAFALYAGADSAFLYDTLKELKKERAYHKIFGKLGAYSFFAMAAAGIASGYLASLLGYRPLFFLTSFLFLLSALIVLTFKEPPIHKHHKNKHLNHLLEAARFSIKHYRIRNLIIYYGLFAAVGHLTWFVIQPFYAKISLSLVGIAVALYMVTAGLGYYFAEKLQNFNEERILVFLLLMASFSFIAMFFVNKILSLLFLSIMSFVCGVRDVIVSDIINKRIDSRHRATINSAQNMSKSLMYAIFSPIIGYFMDIFTPEATFLMLGLTLLAFTGLYCLISRKSASISPAL